MNVLQLFYRRVGRNALANVTDIAFPIIGFQKNGEVLVCFDAKSMCDVRLADIDNGEIAGTHLTDVAGHGWRVRGVDVAKTRWFSSRCVAAYDLDPVAPLPLDEIKDRVCRAMEAEPEDWTDPEILDADKGLMVDPVELIGKETAKIRAAPSLAEICDYFGPYWF